MKLWPRVWCLGFLTHGVVVVVWRTIAVYKHLPSESVIIIVVFGRREFFRQNSMLARCSRIRVES